MVNLVLSAKARLLLLVSRLSTLSGSTRCPLSVATWLTLSGRFKTINIAVGVAIVGHILLIISAIPAVIQKPDGALACFSIAIIIMGLGTGMFKSTVSPLIAEQVKGDRQSVITTEKGENIIVDPALTAGRLFNFFYLAVNIGAVVGQISMIYAEKYVGFYLAYLLPTIVFLICVPVLYFGRHQYVKTPPSGSVLAEALRVIRICLKGNMSWNPVTSIKNMRKDSFWDPALPSSYSDETRPKWMTFDDAWVHEVARGYKACYVFLLFPFYWLCYNQISNNLISQASNLKKNNVPTELTSNLDPIALVILIPIFESFIYPGLRRMKINFTPLKRITVGFWVAAFSMVWAAVTQHYIYKRSPCGDHPSADACIDGTLATDGETDISVWTQTGAFVLVAISEIFVSVVGLEYAFTKAPKSMRSLVMSVFLFTNAIAAAIQQAFLPLTKDPLQVIQYAVFAGLSAFAGILFYFTTRSLDRDEDKMNNLAVGDYAAPNKSLGAPLRDVQPNATDASSDEKH